MDRVEAIIVGGLVVAFLAGAPLAAIVAGQGVYSAGSRTAHAQQATWRQVPAVPAGPPGGLWHECERPPAPGPWSLSDQITAG